MANILQHEILTEFVYPFLLVFFIIFAILEKTKTFGDDKKQLNAFVAFVIGLIFVGAVSPKGFVNNLVLFLAVAAVVILVILMLWGFSTGSKISGEGVPAGLKWAFGIIIVIAVAIAMFLITGVWDTVIDSLFRSNWSSDVWSNVIFVFIIAGALAAVLAVGKSGGK